MEAMHNTTAIVLAGGRGSRMNYQEKAWLVHDGKPLVTHVLERIAPQVKDVIVSSNNEAPEVRKRYQALGIPCFADDPAYQYEGPLAGVVACARHATTDYLLVTPCDTPYLPVNLVELLSKNIAQSKIAVAHDGVNLQPLVVLMHRDQVAGMERYLGTGKRSAKGWLASQEYEEVRIPPMENASLGKTVNIFDNINEPEQLR